MNGSGNLLVLVQQAFISTDSEDDGAENLF